jgi:hypothetical protein
VNKQKVKTEEKRVIWKVEVQAAFTVRVKALPEWSEEEIGGMVENAVLSCRLGHEDMERIDAWASTYSIDLE